MTDDLNSFPALRPVSTRAALVRRLATPRGVAGACIILLSGAGWLYLGLALATPVGEGRSAVLGPGMGVFGWLAGPNTGLPVWLQAFCAASFAGLPSPGAAAGAFALLLAMWVAMTLAMMLPTAAPMLMTYAELAETAARQLQPVVSPFVLAAGYLSVWLVFAAAAAGLTVVLGAGGSLGVSMAPVGGWLAAAIFAGAGLYQFSALKSACLTACQSPFRFFFANWTERLSGVFGLGLRQGMYCLGCCWATMLVMFAVGLMNVIWMAGLGIVMTVEKMVPGTLVRRGIGVALLSIAAVLAGREGVLLAAQQ